MDAATFRAFLDGLADEPAGPRGVERLRFFLQVLSRPDIRYLVSPIVGGGAGAIAAVARGVLEAAGAPTGVLATDARVNGLPLDEALVTQAGTLVAAASYQLGESRVDLGYPTRREAVVALGLTAFAEAGQRVALLVDAAVDPDDPLRAPVPDLVVIGEVDAGAAERAFALVPDGTPVVAAPQISAVRARVEELAKARGIPLLLGERDYRYRESGEGVDVTVGDVTYAALPRAAGTTAAQLATGVAAALALGVLGIRMREEWVVEGARAAAHAGASMGA